MLGVTELSIYAKINTNVQTEIGPNYVISSDTYGEGHVKPELLLVFVGTYAFAGAICCGVAATFEGISNLFPKLLPALRLTN